MQRRIFCTIKGVGVGAGFDERFHNGRGAIEGSKVQSSNLSGRTVLRNSRLKFNFQVCNHVFLLAPKAWGLLIFGCVLVTVILVLVVTLVL